MNLSQDAGFCTCIYWRGWKLSQGLSLKNCDSQALKDNKLEKLSENLCSHLWNNICKANNKNKIVSNWSNNSQKTLWWNMFKVLRFCESLQILLISIDRNSCYNRNNGNSENKLNWRKL